MPLLFNDATYQPQRLRDYQQAAVAAIREAWSRDEPAPLAALATGAGKTTIIAQLLRETLNVTCERALVLAHTEEIVVQLRDRIANQFEGELDTSFGEYYAPGIGIVMGKQDDADARIVCATRQSLHNSRLKRLLVHGAFDILVIDEAHHAFGDNSYGGILDTLRKANPDLNVVGFTATPSRGDGLALGSVFSDICFQWLIPDGIAAGYLTPVTRIKVTTSVDTSDVKTSRGDYAQTRLVSVLETNNWLDLALQAYWQYIADTGRQTLAFFPTVEMSRQFVTRLIESRVDARHIDGETPKDVRRQVLRDYAEGRVRLVSNFGVLTEGFDAPMTSALLMARPTRSRTLYTQIVGRGLRPYPGKHDCLLVDLAVTDTRALEVGSLLGRMTRCPKCLNEHYAGLKACPMCGHIVSWKQRAAAGIAVTPDMTNGSGLIANFEPLFEKSFAAWYNGGDGFFSCTLSFEDGALIIIPPLEDNYYRLARVPSDRQKPVEYLTRNEDLASLMLEADEYILKQGAQSAAKEAGWREHPATMAQLNVLGKLGVTVPRGVSKGAASQMITHAISVKRLLQE